ncbi:MAG: hypothetical protein WCS97_02480 [Candidatus Paceibacterota bacterium]|jgi:hypothetical protein
MLTDADIARIVAVVATKEDVKLINERLGSLEENLNKFVTASDKFTGSFEALRLEYAAVSTQLTRHEDWIKQIAEKSGVALQF